MKRLRALLAGCGEISEVWLRALSQIPSVEVAGLVDLEESRARARMEDFDLRGVALGWDIRDVLDRTNPDVVFDCTVPDAHVEIAEAALRFPCHLLSEKPLAHTMAAARKILEAMERSGKKHAVLQNRRFDPNIRRIRRFLEEGRIGGITTLNSDFYIGAHFGGFRQKMRHVLLLDMAIHTFDAARFLSGADPVSVFCHEWNPEGSWYDHGASAVAVFEMTGGIVYTYRGSWCSEGLNTDWHGSWRVVGEKGSLSWEGGDEIQAQVAHNTGEFISPCEDLIVEPWTGEAMDNGHLAAIRAFVQALQSGREPECASRDNIKSLAMVFGAVESAKTGRPYLFSA